MIMRGQEQYIVRFPDGMRARVKAEAAHNQRSMNAEIVYHLTQAYSGKKRSPEIVAAMVDEAKETFGDAAADQLAARQTI